MNFPPPPDDSSTARSPRQTITSPGASTLSTFLHSDLGTDGNCKWEPSSNVYQPVSILSGVRAIVTKIMFFEETLGVGCGCLERKMPIPVADGFDGTGVGAIKF